MDEGRGFRTPPPQRGGPPRHECPECSVTGHEFALRSHLLETHEWTPAAVEAFFSGTGESYNEYGGHARPSAGDDVFATVFSELFQSAPATERTPSTDDPATVGSEAAGLDGPSDDEQPPWSTTDVDRIESGERMGSPSEAPSGSGETTDDGAATETPATESDDPLSRVCDCDPKFKETQIIQKDTGLSIGAIGGNRETGVPVIICKNCATQYPIGKQPNRGRLRFLGRRD